MATPTMGGLNRERPDAGIVRARVEVQERGLDAVSDSLVAALQDRIGFAEDGLTKVSQPVIAEMKRRVAAQEEQLAAITYPLVSAIRTNVGRQDALLANVSETLPGVGIPVFTGADGNDTSPPPPPPPIPVPTLTDVASGPAPPNPCSYPFWSYFPPSTQRWWVWTASGPSGPVGGITYEDSAGQQLHFLTDARGCAVSPPPPSAPPPPTSPPASPPPPPAGPPPVVFPTPAPGTCATRPAPVVTHERIDWQWQNHHWFFFKCEVGCPVDVTHVVTPDRTPPPGVVGQLFGPYLEPPTAAFVRSKIREAACDATTPTSPPPPTVPGVPPPPTSPPPLSSPPPPPGTTPTTPTTPPNAGVCWGAVDVCSAAEKITATVDPGTPSTADKFDRNVKQVIDVVSGPALYLGSKLAEWVGGVDPLDTEEFREQARDNLASNILGTGYSTTVLSGLPRECVPDPATFLAMAPVLVASNLAARTSGLPIDYFTQSLVYSYQYANPQYIPEQPAIDTQYLAGRLSRREWECLTRAHGNHPAPFYRSIEAHQTQPGVLELMRLWLQGKVNEEQLRDRLRKLGVLDESYIPEYKRLVTLTPTASDAIHWTIRDVFDPNKFDREAMIKEYHEQKGMKETLDAIGVRDLEVITPDGKPFTIETGLNNWLASYTYASPTQMYEGLHRFRPNRVHRYPLRDEAGNVTYPRPINIQHVRKNLKEHDYAPGDRDMLAASSYRIAGRIDVKNIYKRRGFGTPLGLKGFDLSDPTAPVAKGVAEVELYERFQDMGYPPLDAQLQAYDAAASFDQSRDLRNRNRHLGIICKQFAQKVITRGEALAQTEKVVTDSAVAERIVLLCEAEAAARDFNAAVGGIRRQYLSGEIDKPTALERLRKVGVAGGRVGEYFVTWDYQRQVKTREVTAGQILDWYRQRIIDKAEATARLVNLHYKEDDAARMVRIAELGELAKTSREQERIAKAAQAAQRRREAALKSDAKAAAAAQEKAITRRLAAKSDKNMAAWWKAGIITEPEIRGALLMKGWEPVDVDRWIVTNRPKGESNEPE